MVIITDGLHPLPHEPDEGHDAIVVDAPANASLSEPVIDEILIWQVEGRVVTHLRKSSERHEAIGLGPGRKGREPLIADGEVPREEIEDGDVGRRVVPHDV